MSLTQKIVLSVLLVLGLASVAQASSGGAVWDKVPNRMSDQAALQNGAKLFVNYCLNCHSAAFQRYNRLQDIGLTADQIKNNLLLTNGKIGETMKAAIDPQQAKGWFGQSARFDRYCTLTSWRGWNWRGLFVYLYARFLCR